MLAGPKSNVMLSLVEITTRSRVLINMRKLNNSSSTVVTTFMFNISDDDMSQDEVTVPATVDSGNRVEGVVGGGGGGVLRRGSLSRNSCSLLRTTLPT